MTNAYANCLILTGYVSWQVPFPLGIDFPRSKLRGWVQTILAYPSLIKKRTKSALEMDGGDGGTLRVYLIPLNCTLQNV